MSRRPPVRPGRATRMAPGGRMWSESPVRQPEPRVRQMGAEALACGPDYPRTALGSSSATFTATSPFAFIALTFRLVYTSSADCQVRVASIGGSAAETFTPTLWEVLPAAPSGATLSMWQFAAGSGSLTDWVIEWDADVVSDLCATPVDNG